MITIYDKNTRKKFKEIENGSLFRHEQNIYIKTTIKDVDDFIYGVNLKNGLGVSFGDNAYIEPLKGELRIL